jgi:hypothetical protein
MTTLIAMGAMGGDASTHLSAQVFYTTGLVLFIAFVMPVVAIAIIVKKSTSPEVRNSVAGLGTMSLHEELDEFIAAVESGNVTMKSLRDESARSQAAGSPHKTASTPGT